MAVEHAARLTSQELQDFVCLIASHLNSNGNVGCTTNLLRDVRKRARAGRRIVGRNGLKHDSPNQCLLRALELLLRMSKRTPRRSDYIKILLHCAATADMYGMETFGGSFYLDECDYHNRVLNPMVTQLNPETI